MTAVATFMPTVGQAREAGFFPSRHTVEIVDNRMLADGVYRLTFRDEFIAGQAGAVRRRVFQQSEQTDAPPVRRGRSGWR